MDVGRLKAIPLFESVTDEQLKKIAPFVSEVSVGEGNELVKQGDYSYELMAIEEGSANVVHDGSTIATLGPGDFFGEMGLLDRGRRNADVVATSPMRLFTFSRWELGRMEKAMPEVVAEIRNVIEARSTRND